MFPELELMKENTIVLCVHCHFHFGHLNNFKKFNPNILSLVKITDNYTLADSVNQIIFQILEDNKERIRGVTK